MDETNKSMFYTKFELLRCFEGEWTGSVIKSEEGAGVKPETAGGKMQKDRSHISEDPSKPQKETNCLNVILQGEMTSVVPSQNIKYIVI